MKRPFSLIFCLKVAIVLVWLGVFGVWVKNAINLPPPPALDTDFLRSSEDYFITYFKGEKIGWSQYSLTNLDDSYISEQRSFITLNVGGQQEEIRTISTARLGLDFSLQSFNFIMSSGPVVFKATGKVSDQQITVTSQSGVGDKTTHSFNFTDKLIMPSALPFQMARLGLKKGDRYTISLFDPLSMAIKPATIIVDDEGQKHIPEKTSLVKAFRLRLDYLGIPVYAWVDETGRTIEEEGQMGLKLVRATAEEAQKGFQGTGSLNEVIAASAVKVNYDSNLSPAKKNDLTQNPRGIRYLSATLSGAALDGFALNGAGQRYENGRLTVKTPSLTQIKSWPEAQENAPFLADYLKSEPLIQADNPEIQTLAAELKIGKPTRLSQVRAVMDWTYHNLEKRPSLSLPSATEVMGLKYGDCNEHTILAVAILRALGIPARPVAGLLYYNQSFTYHAWVEVYLYDRWVPVDPLLGITPAGATHLRFVIGNLEQQTKLIGLMGRLQVTINDVSANPGE